MIFRNFAERLLGSKVKIKLVAHLLGSQMPVSERALARQLGVSHVAVNKALKELQDAHFVRSMKIGTATVWSVNKNSYAYWALDDIRRLDRLPLDVLIAELFLKFKSLPCIQKAVLYGSVAEGKEMPASDIDLLIICGKASDKQFLSGKLVELSYALSERYGDSLHPVVLTSLEANQTKNQKLIENARNGLTVVAR